MAIYVVEQGDNVNIIADYYGIDVNRLIYDNQLVYPYALAIGQALYVAQDDVDNRNGTMRINGYAYPFIQRDILSETLDYLTELSIFSYGFTTTGNLIPPTVAYQWMITLAREKSAIPILTLTPLDAQGKFNNNLITAVLNDSNSTNQLIQNLLDEVNERGFGGVDVDFEYILETDRDAFTTFVARLRNVMNENGYSVSVALAPQNSPTDLNKLNVGMDYGGLGAAADRVLLMTYEYGYKYGPNLAIAPIDEVRKVVEYAITQIPRNKINLGIPNYGYDWPLPYINGVTEADTITNVEAVQIAVRTGSTIQYDTVSQAPFFNYTYQGVNHEVWFEDVRSILAKINLIREYGLGGAGYWQINSLFRANWLLLNSETNILKI